VPDPNKRPSLRELAKTPVNAPSLSMIKKQESYRRFSEKLNQWKAKQIGSVLDHRYPVKTTGKQIVINSIIEDLDRCPDQGFHLSLYYSAPFSYCELGAKLIWDPDTRETNRVLITRKAGNDSGWENLKEYELGHVHERERIDLPYPILSYRGGAIAVAVFITLNKYLHLSNFGYHFNPPESGRVVDVKTIFN
jgi:hypothetical protein